MTRIAVAAVFALLLLSTTPGQISTEGRGYVATPTILSKPDLKIPREAKESGIGGSMRVRVVIDAAGNVASVDSVSGPGAVCQQVDREDVHALRESAKDAALQTKFVPLTKGVVPAATLYFEVKGNIHDSVNSLISGEELPPGRGEEKFFSASNAPSTEDKGPVSVAGNPDKDNDKSGAETLSGGVLNGKASDLPKPSFPPAAMAVRATGSVPVQVLIEEDGKVFLARAAGGHPLLRTAATSAACKATFMPTLLSGKPVKVTGIITYNFVP